MASRVVLHVPDFRELRTSPAMDRHILRWAERVARSLGPGFVADLQPGKNRARAIVIPVTFEARQKVAENPSLIIGAMKAAG